MGVEKYTTAGGKTAWMVDLTATLPSGQEVRFRKRKIATKEQAKALEAKKLEEIFMPGTSQSVPASLREVVGAALRALRAGRLDMAVDMLERLSRALDGDSA